MSVFERNTTTCFKCGVDFPDRDMMPLPDEGEVCPACAKTALFDVCGFVMDYEAGELDEQAVVSGFQHLIDSGLVWTLQGHYGRMATRLIEDGRCVARGAS